MALDALYIVVVNGNEPLDRCWECISERLVSNRGVSEGVEAVQVLVKNEPVDVKVGEDAHEGVGWWRVYTSAQNDWSAEMFVVSVGAGCVGGESGLGGGCCEDVGSGACGGVSSRSSLKTSRTSDCSS